MCQLTCTPSISYSLIYICKMALSSHGHALLKLWLQLHAFSCCELHDVCISVLGVCYVIRIVVLLCHFEDNAVFTRTTCWIEWAGCRFPFGTCGTQMRRKQLWIKLHAGKCTSSSVTMAQGPATAISSWNGPTGKYIFQVRSLKGPFTLKSFVAWFLDDVLVKMLPTMRKHGITWVGCANRLGQKPIAQAARKDPTFSKQGLSPNSHQLPSVTECCSVWMLPSSRPS